MLLIRLLAVIHWKSYLSITYQHVIVSLLLAQCRCYSFIFLFSLLISDINIYDSRYLFTFPYVSS